MPVFDDFFLFVAVVMVTHVTIAAVGLTQFADYWFVVVSVKTISKSRS